MTVGPDGDRVVGALLYQKFDNVQTDLILLAVHQSHRRQKIATDLLWELRDNLGSEFNLASTVTVLADDDAFMFYRK